MQCSLKTLPSMQTTRRSDHAQVQLAQQPVDKRPYPFGRQHRDTALSDDARFDTSDWTGSSVRAYCRVVTPAAIASSVMRTDGTQGVPTDPLGVCAAEKQMRQL